MEEFFTILSVTLGFLGALAMLFNWFDLITRFQLKRNSNDYRSAVKMIEKSEAQFDKHFTGKEITGKFYLVGALYGLFFAQRMNAAASTNFINYFGALSI